METKNHYDVIIVGAGIAGLTSAAYLSKAGYSVLLVEKADKTGGLVNSFAYQGFTFDGGIRAIEDSGIVFPMLKQLRLQVPFVKSSVSIGIEDQYIHLGQTDGLAEYQQMLTKIFPDNADDIRKIIQEIAKVSAHMDVIYGIDNPLFHDLKAEKDFLFKTVLPWLPKYSVHIKKAGRLNQPINDYLSRFTKNQSLIDMIAQHFFKNTPSFFALSYFRLYHDYIYPLGGTGAIVDALVCFIRDHHGEILLQSEITAVDSQQKTIKTFSGDDYRYRKLIWAADSKKFYRSVDVSLLKDPSEKKKAEKKKMQVLSQKGGDSIFTVFITADIEKEYFAAKTASHLFYTPKRHGISGLPLERILSDQPNQISDKKAVFKLLADYFDWTTYEVSIPVLSDETLAPKGKTGIIVSTLIDYSLVNALEKQNWYEEFKTWSQAYIVDVLDASVFPCLKAHVTATFSSSPRTIERLSGNAEGAITGWAFNSRPMPAEHRFPKIANSVNTPFKDIYQAGQWTFSPSGFPVSILTGKVAADTVIKKLRHL